MKASDIQARTTLRVFDIVLLPWTSDNAYGDYHVLNATTTLSVVGNVRNVSRMTFFMKSASTVEGVVCLKAYLNGNLVQTFLVTATAAWQEKKLLFSTLATGKLTFVRDTASTDDTLKATDVVDCLIDSAGITAEVTNA